MNDRTRWNEKYSNDHSERRMNVNLVRAVSLLARGRVLDLAGGLGQNGVWLAAQDSRFQVVVADVSDEALTRVEPNLARVQADAQQLPFAPASFATILCIRYFEPRVRFAELLEPGGTVFFETFTTEDSKYRPDFNPAHRFDLQRLDEIFAGLEILDATEKDDGRRVRATVIARKPM